MKEHARRSSTKPLNATRPGENGVADLMFIEGRNDVKTPFYVHVDVANKLEQLTFDRESAIAVMQEDIEARGIKLTLKVAGQKVGLGRGHYSSN